MFCERLSKVLKASNLVLLVSFAILLFAPVTAGAQSRNLTVRVDSKAMPVLGYSGTNPSGHWATDTGGAVSAVPIVVSPGDTININSVYSTFSRGNGTCSCLTGCGGDDKIIPKHVMTLQFTDGSAVWPGSGLQNQNTVKNFPTALRDTRSQSLANIVQGYGARIVVPDGATRIFFSIPDSKYDDNGGVCSVDLTITSPTYFIQGNIPLPNTVSPLQGALVTAGAYSAVTDANGFFTIYNVPVGTYTVTPSKAGYTFVPVSKTVSVVNANVTGVDFRTITQCSDGFDNDNDGAIDTVDFGCSDMNDTDEANPKSQCQDGIDNDGDGLIDRLDPGCWNNPADPNTYNGNLNNESRATTQCQDGIDNDDRDGVADRADPGCWANTSDPNTYDRTYNDEGRATTKCQDGLDNDGDGRTDYPSDPGCSSKTDDNERGTGVCDNGIDDDGDGKTDYPADPGCIDVNDGNERDPQCRDNIDNDADGLTDRNDPGCWTNPADPNTYDLNLDNEARATTQCQDGIDNDDRDGVADRADPGCWTNPADPNTYDRTINNEGRATTQCQDTIDNDDRDGVADSADPGCWTNPNNPSTYDRTRNNEGAATTQCQDSIDNDGDGVIDRGDPGCWTNPADSNTYDRTRNNEGAATTQCQDGLDNDADTLVDRNDPGCRSNLADPNSYDRTKNSESNPPQCADGIDNDGDGRVDQNDLGCSGPSDNNESDDPLGPRNLSASDGTQSDFVAVNWTAGTVNSTYDLYRSDVSGGLGVIIASALSGTTYNDTTANPGTVYYYTVRATVNNLFSNVDSGFRPERESARLKSPIYTKFNTFLGQSNFLELINEGTQSNSVRVSVYNRSGSVIGQRTVLLNGKEQFDLDINQVVASACPAVSAFACVDTLDLDANGVVDTYGLVRLDFDDSDSNKAITGRLSNYRLNPGKSSYSFAFARELRNPNRGSTYATANTMDPQGQGFLVPNWAEIINLDSVNSRSFTYRLYNMSGLLVFQRSFVLPPLGEADVQAGHEVLNSIGQRAEAVYMGEVVSDGDYLFSISRYSSNSVNTAASTYNFAFPVDARAGSSETIYVPITNEDRLASECAIPTNWVEVVNVRNDSVNILASFRNSDGSLISSQPMNLSAKSQFHFNASALLAKGSQGTAVISADKPGAIIAESLTYYHDCQENLTQTAFALSAKLSGRKVQTGSINTFLGIENLLRVFATTAQAVSASYQLTSSSGQLAGGVINFNSLGQGEVNVNALPGITANTYGVFRLESQAEGQVGGYVLRVRREFDSNRQRLDFVMPIELR